MYYSRFAFVCILFKYWMVPVIFDSLAGTLMAYEPPANNTPFIDALFPSLFYHTGDYLHNYGALEYNRISSIIHIRPSPYNSSGTPPYDHLVITANF